MSDYTMRCTTLRKSQYYHEVWNKMNGKQNVNKFYRLLIITDVGEGGSNCLHDNESVEVLFERRNVNVLIFSFLLKKNKASYS